MRALVTLREIPQFHVAGWRRSKGELWLRGRFSTSRGIYTRCGWFYRPEGLSVAVDVRWVDCRSLTADVAVQKEFEPFLLSDVSVWPFVDERWAPSQIDLVMEDAEWVQVTYAGADPPMTSSDGRVFPDKELCEICQARAMGEGHEPVGYRRSCDLEKPNTEGAWVCCRCYRLYVSRKNLSFVFFKGWKPRLHPWPPR